MHAAILQPWNRPHKVQTDSHVHAESIPGLILLTHSGADSVAAVKSELHCNHWEGKVTLKNNSRPVVLCSRGVRQRGKMCFSFFISL